MPKKMVWIVFYEEENGKYGDPCTFEAHSTEQSALISAQRYNEEYPHIMHYVEEIELVD